MSQADALVNDDVAIRSLLACLDEIVAVSYCIARTSGAAKSEHTALFTHTVYLHSRAARMVRGIVFNSTETHIKVCS